MGKRVRMGRPPGPPERVRRNRVTFTVTDSELADLERLADEQGLPVGTFIYQIVARSLARRRKR